MKRLVLALFVFISFTRLSAQNSANIQRDSIFKNIAATAVADTIAVPSLEDLMVNQEHLSYKLRLDSLQKTVPLNYNEYVQGFIDKYSRRKDLFGKMLGLSAYYFPIFEKALSAYQIPDEIKYLPIIESEMNPHAVSRVGATGIWQFMFGTAKAYGLKMDNFVDERKDPIQASFAAAAYFRDAYEELGDWLLALAAYNCGKGSVTRAIDKAGSRDFWQIRPYLPKETRDYVPAFIAALYMMRYHQTHQISAQAPTINLNIDTIQVSHFVSLADLAKAIDYEEETLAGLNPSYKKRIVNGTTALPKRIILPKVDYLNYARLYDVLTVDFDTNQDVTLTATDDVREQRKKIGPKTETSKLRIHRVKAGQNLNTIAALHHVEVQDLKSWNNLTKNALISGQQLKVYPPVDLAKLSKPVFITYKVKAGDTLSGIAEKFEGVTVAGIKKVNKLASAVLQPGMVLKIKG